jgi:hypothetical protein
VSNTRDSSVNSATGAKSVTDAARKKAQHILQTVAVDGRDPSGERMAFRATHPPADAGASLPSWRRCVGPMGYRAYFGYGLTNNPTMPVTPFR